MKAEDLIKLAAGCTVCPRMNGERAILGQQNGSWNARILFVAEAPGRLGAARTGIPLHGDRTGDRFEELLGQMRLQRSEAFITNAVLCNPKDERGRNATPRTSEVRSCGAHLSAIIQVVQPAVVISLGAVALRALGYLDRHDFRISEACGRLERWSGLRLGVLYHPGPRTAVHRSWAEQLADAKLLGRRVRRHLLTLPPAVETQSTERPGLR